MTSDYERIRRDNIREYGEGTRHLDILQRLYADRTHFIFELLQNAEDARATQVTFVLAPHQLVVQHDGRPFNEADVRGICGVSASTKEDELTAIGKFGIGFKSVYAYTTLPEVHSGEEHFRIRHYVRPEPAAWHGDSLNGGTLFLFPFDRDDLAPELAYDEIAEGLMHLDPIALLFLQHVRDVTFESESGTGTVQLTRICSDTDLTNVELIRRTAEQVMQHEYWWKFGRSLDHIGHPNQRVEIAFKRAGPEPGAPIERLSSSPLVAYFPTDKESRLGFLIQAPLRTTPARDNVPENDPENIALIGQATGLLLDTLELLRDTGRLGLDVFEALPIDAEAFRWSPMLRPLFEGVRDALRTRALLPTAGDAGHVSAREIRLARGGGIRALLSPAQLAVLAGASGPLHWQPSQLTRERTRLLWDYLRHQVGVEEITPEWIVGHLTPAFLQEADESWLIGFYAFLAQSPALWRPSRGSWDQPGPARMLPLIRLEDDSHVAPFGADGRPNAYLPSSTPSNFPTVRRTIVARSEARSFLISLGLQEPDAVADVLENVLPRYQANSSITDGDQHFRDLVLISRAMRDASGKRRATLVDRLRSTAFLSARTADHSAVGVRTPAECYWPNDDLEHYFRPSQDAWFLAADYDEYRGVLTELGVADHVRVKASPANYAGQVVLRARYGDHSRGLNGFDPELRISGLDAALANPDPRRSAYVWNVLLAPRADRLRGIVESASRQDYSNSRREEQDTEPYRLASNRAWLPRSDGDYVMPQELALEDIPPEFVRHNGLADTLGMITPVVQQASTQLGISVETLRFLADNPEALAAVEAERALRSTNASPSLSVGKPLSPLDFAAKLQDVFDRPPGSNHMSDDGDGSFHDNGYVGAPVMRRERTAAAIEEARAAESSPQERFRFLPRKVWDGKDPAVRQFLLEQYAGHCQICDTTFLKRDGGPYFEVVYLVSHTNAAWVDRPGDVLCLCPTCAAKFQHGELHASDMLGQIRSWQTRTEGGEKAALHLTLCGESHTIHYAEKHLLDLQAMVTGTAQSGPS
ncbi:sacsin N-terminal ATP-binding-like domain-containing protein [Microbispora rosea]|uniref:sacsin N-terminal ATP-binding-like domain-containing protein n=1 Tax=Microbispora rosea TaxID=58117 RepID=UPI00341F0967